MRNAPHALGDHFRHVRQIKLTMVCAATLVALGTAAAHADRSGQQVADAHAGHHGFGHDALHDWYKTLRHPGTGYECCDGRDCRPTRARFQKGDLQVLVDGEWTRVPSDALIKTPSPDLQTHVCAPKGSWSPKVIFCVVLGQGV